MDGIDVKPGTALRAGIAALGLLGGMQSGWTETVLHVAYQEDMSTFDPDNAFALYGLDALRATYQGLIQYKPGSTELTGWLAESWSVSNDGLTYRFRLHRGVRFHDGHALTASDVLAYFRRRKSPDLALSYFLNGVAGMSAPDADTFVIRLAAPDPSFLDRLASAWGPKIVGPGALVDHAGSDHAETWLNDHEDGTGPYRMTEFNRGQRYVLSRNEDYWGKRPYFDRIQIEIVPTMAQQMLMLRKGDLDLIQTGYPFEQLHHLPGGLRMLVHDDLGLEMAFVNGSRRLRDRLLRKAVLTAMNPAGWLDDAFFGFATPAHSLYPRAMIGAPAPLEFPSDVGKARAIVAHAAPLSLDIGYEDQESAVQQHPAELLASALEQIGIHATVRPYPSDQVPLFADDLEHAPDLFIAENYPDAAHPSTQAGVFFARTAPLNYFAYKNAQIDQLIDAAALVNDPADRDRRYLDISKRLFADMAFVPLADIRGVIVYREGLTDLDTRPALPWVVDYESIRRE